MNEPTLTIPLTLDDIRAETAQIEQDISALKAEQADIERQLADSWGQDVSAHQTRFDFLGAQIRAGNERLKELSRLLIDATINHYLAEYEAQAAVYLAKQAAAQEAAREFQAAEMNLNRAKNAKVQADRDAGEAFNTLQHLQGELTGRNAHQELSNLKQRLGLRGKP